MSLCSWAAAYPDLTWFCCPCSPSGDLAAASLLSSWVIAATMAVTLLPLSVGCLFKLFIMCSLIPTWTKWGQVSEIEFFPAFPSPQMPAVLHASISSAPVISQLQVPAASLGLKIHWKDLVKNHRMVIALFQTRPQGLLGRLGWREVVSPKRRTSRSSGLAAFHCVCCGGEGGEAPLERWTCSFDWGVTM